MQEDVFPAAEKILADIENVLEKDHNLIGFEIIPAEDNENKSPVFHAENYLGLASWSVQPLFCYVYNRLLDLRQNKYRREDPVKISRWLLGAVLLNPDISTFWNMKRELVKNRRLDPMQELRFSSIVLYYKSKCFEAFVYRRWLIKFLLTNTSQSSFEIETLVRNEIKVATMTANRYCSNNHAWCHRQYAVGLFETLAKENFYSFLQTEWETTSNWCSRNVSDYSGFAYRQFLLKKLLFIYPRNDEMKISLDKIARHRTIVLEYVKNDKRDCKNETVNSEFLCLLHGVSGEKAEDCDQTVINLSYWIEECVLNEDLIKTFPGHEALWCHRRFLAYSLLALINSYKKYFQYKSEIFDNNQTQRHLNRENKLDSAISRGHLKEAFHIHNQDLIAQAKSSGPHQNFLAEKFIKYLVNNDLEQ